MSDKKAYVRQVDKQVKVDRSVDKLYRQMAGVKRPPRSAAETRARATRLVDSDIETKVRGYVKGSLGDPNFGKPEKATPKPKPKVKK